MCQNSTVCRNQSTALVIGNQSTALSPVSAEASWNAYISSTAQGIEPWIEIDSGAPPEPPAPPKPPSPRYRCPGLFSSRARSRLAAVPDHDGLRFCRFCEDFLPITEFPRGQRRYTCRMHHWERTGRKAKKTLLTKPGKKLLNRIWMQCYKDRVVFGQHRVELTQADIGALIDSDQRARVDSDQRARVDPDNCPLRDSEPPTNELIVLPKDTRKPISRENAMLASKEVRRELLRSFR